MNKHQQVNGLSWWYAEANAKGCTGDLKEGWYNASLFDNETGRALPALYELKNYVGEDTGIHNIEMESRISDSLQWGWYGLDGCRFSNKPESKGLYVHQGKKVVIK